MEKRAEKAAELFRQGYNCAQSVFAAFCDITGYDFDDAVRLASSFGGGMGRLREVCGAVSAMFMIAGIKYGYTDPADSAAKTEHYRLIQSLAEKFKERYGTVVCRDLLRDCKRVTYVPAARTGEYYKTRPCTAIVEYAAAMTDELLQHKQEVNQ